MFFSHASQLNIFFFDRDPAMCAFAHCDEHIHEMIPVYTQILSNAHHKLEDDLQNTIAGYRNFYRWWVDNNDCEWSAPEGATRTAPDWIIRAEETIDANV